MCIYCVIQVAPPVIFEIVLSLGLFVNQAIFLGSTDIYLLFYLLLAWRLVIPEVGFEPKL